MLLHRLLLHRLLLPLLLPLLLVLLHRLLLVLLHRLLLMLLHWLLLPLLLVLVVLLLLLGRAPTRSSVAGCCNCDCTRPSRCRRRRHRRCLQFLQLPLHFGAQALGQEPFKCLE